MSDSWGTLTQQKLLSAHTVDASQPVYFPLTAYGVISIKGADAKKFLQGQLTADLEQVNEKQSRMAAFCTPQGRIRSLMVLAQRSEDDYLAILPTSNIENTVSSLQKFAVFYQVSLQSVSDNVVVYGIQAPASEENMKLFDCRIDNEQLRISFGPQRQLIISPLAAAESVWQSVDNVLPENHWQSTDIQMGLPWIDQEATDTFLPHNLDLPAIKAVSFEKGCYTGQEVVARMHYKGKLKSHMRLLKGSTTIVPSSGTPIYGDDKKMGEIICASSAGDTLWILALCKDAIENSTKIHCDAENTPILRLCEIHRTE